MSEDTMSNSFCGRIRCEAADQIDRLRLWAEDEQQKREKVEEQRMEARSEIERLRAALATVHVFIEGEMIAHAVTVPEGARADDPKNPTLLQVVERALGLDEHYVRKDDADH